MAILTIGVEREDGPEVSEGGTDTERTAIGEPVPIRLWRSGTRLNRIATPRAGRARLSSRGAMKASATVKAFDQEGTAYGSYRGF